MNKITLAQREALGVVKDMIDRSNTNVPDYGAKIMSLILGILNIDYRVESTITRIDEDKSTPINPNNGNDRIHIDIPDWVKDLPTPPFSPHTPFPPQVWYKQEPEPIQTNVPEEVRYATEVTCTGDKNGIVCTTNTANVRYNGDFRDEQTSFNDK